MTTICVNPDTAFLIYDLTTKEVEFIKLYRGPKPAKWVAKPEECFDIVEVYDAGLAYLIANKCVFDTTKQYRRFEKPSFMQDVSDWKKQKNELISDLGYSIDEAEAELSLKFNPRVFIAARNAEDLDVAGDAGDLSGGNGKIVEQEDFFSPNI